MKTIEDHIEFDKQRIEDPTVSSAARRHYKDELVAKGFQLTDTGWVKV